MPILPSGHIVGISSERARYHATRRHIRIDRDTPHQDLYPLIDIVYANADDEHPWSNGYRFTGYTISDRQWLKSWKRADRDSFLKWIMEGGAFREIEGARNKVIYDTLPHKIATYDYPDRLYSILRRRISAMTLSSAGPDQWRNTILNMRHCGVREEEIRWSGVIDFLDDAKVKGRESITREELLGRVDFTQIRLELANELVVNNQSALDFQERAEILSPQQSSDIGLELAVGEYVVMRYNCSRTHYRIAYIGSRQSNLLCQRRWIVIDGDRKPIADKESGSTGYFDTIEEAMAAALGHAVEHKQIEYALSPGAKYDYMSLHGGDDYREWILTLPDYHASHFTSHFTERNVLLHIRTKSRIDSSGQRLLFIEEIQSDWNQQLTSKNSTAGLSGRVPEAPFKKEWALLALKLMLQYAVKQGYGSIAWAPGHIQQLRYQCDNNLLLRLYDKTIPQHFLHLSRDWNGSIDTTHIKTREPWLSPRRNGDKWFVSDRSGQFTTAKRLSREQAVAIADRHSKSIDLDVSVFHIPSVMAEKIARDALPLFGEMVIDKVEKPLCGTGDYKECDVRLKTVCFDGE